MELAQVPGMVLYGKVNKRRLEAFHSTEPHSIHGIAIFREMLIRALGDEFFSDWTQIHQFNAIQQIPTFPNSDKALACFG